MEGYEGGELEKLFSWVKRVKKKRRGKKGLLLFSKSMSGYYRRGITLLFQMIKRKTRVYITIIRTENLFNIPTTPAPPPITTFFIDPFYFIFVEKKKVSYAKCVYIYKNGQWKARVIIFDLISNKLLYLKKQRNKQNNNMS